MKKFYKFILYTDILITLFLLTFFIYTSISSILYNPNTNIWTIYGVPSISILVSIFLIFNFINKLFLIFNFNLYKKINIPILKNKTHYYTLFIILGYITIILIAFTALWPVTIILFLFLLNNTWIYKKQLKV